MLQAKVSAGETPPFSETHRAIEATFRIERARLIAGLARMVRNVDLAEELAQDALVVALSEWPRTGVRANPGASGYSSHRHSGAQLVANLTSA